MSVLNTDETIDSSIIGSKPGFKNDPAPDFEVDLTQPNQEYRLQTSFSFVVQKKDEMRLDKICQQVYNRTDYVHQLMKINGLFNPFRIKKGDSLLIGKTEEIENIQDEPVEQAFTRQALVDELKRSQIDPSRIEFLKGKLADTDSIQERQELEQQIAQLERDSVEIPVTVTPEDFQSSQFNSNGTELEITPTLNGVDETFALNERTPEEVARQRRQERSQQNKSRLRRLNRFREENLDQSVVQEFEVNAKGLNPALLNQGQLEDQEQQKSGQTEDKSTENLSSFGLAFLAQKNRRSNAFKKSKGQQ